MKKTLITILSFTAIFLGWQMLPQEETLSLGGTLQVAGSTYTLAGSGISSTATSFTLTSFSIPQNGALINDAALSDTFYVTFEPGSRSRQEIASCTTVVQNAGGTATLSGCVRGLSPISPYTASTTLRFAHSGGSTVILSDPPQLFNQYGALANDEVITGAWTAITPVAALGIATKAYVDSVVNGGALTLDGIAMGATAGETFATGTIVYFDAANTKEWMKADASTAASAVGVQLGIAQGVGADGVAIPGGVLTRGYDSTQTGMTIGQTLYLSDTAGATSTSAGTNTVVLGQARTASVFYFDPIYGNIPTPNDVGIIVMNAGGTINGATLPVPVYASSTDSEVYAADANVTQKMKFIGFAVTNSTDGNAITIQTEGVVDGFTGLSIGEKYYLSDTVGTIATTAGTQEILTGIALSSTQVMIQKGQRFAAGTFQQADAGADETVSTTTIELGFRPSVIRMTAVMNTFNDTHISTGVYANGTNHSNWTAGDGATSAIGRSDVYTINLWDSAGTETWQGTIALLTDTGFSVSTKQKVVSPSVAYFVWEAEGEI